MKLNFGVASAVFAVCAQPLLSIYTAYSISGNNVSLWFYYTNAAKKWASRGVFDVDHSAVRTVCQAYHMTSFALVKVR